MAMRAALSFTILSVALFAAQDGLAEPLSGPDLVRELSDNTLTGFNGSLWFSEYHAPDGRVLGHNGGRQNWDACWKVRGDAVCYYYPSDRRGEENQRREFCWHLERVNPDGFKLTPVGRPGGGIARLERGNRGLTDNGKTWTCDALISRYGPRQPASFAAARPTGRDRAEVGFSAAPSP